MTRHPDSFLHPEDDSALLASPSLWAAVFLFWTLITLFGALLA